MFGDGDFPFSVVTVNLVGSFVLGLYLARREWAVDGRGSLQFWAIGLLGSFTTFSAFSLDLVLLIDAGRAGEAGAYLLVSLFGGLMAAIGGQRVGRAI